MNKKNKNWTILLVLIFSLVSLFGGLGYYIYKKRINDKNQEIMINEIKNNIINRNYKKAHSISEILKDRYPKNQDILMLESTLAELKSNNSFFESKDSKKNIANLIIDKIQGKKTISKAAPEITFNNRFIEDKVITENYADRNENNIGINKSDIVEFQKGKISPEKLNTNQKTIDKNLNPNKDLFNLEILKDNLNGKLKNEIPKTEIMPIEKSVKIAKSNSQKNEEAKPINKSQIQINKIEKKIKRPYSYLVKKELYEILDDIKTGKLLTAKKRLNNMISKELSTKFKRIIDLIDAFKNQEASELLITLIKKDIEPNLTNDKDNSKKEFSKHQAQTKYIDQKEIESKKKQKEKFYEIKIPNISDIKESDLDDLIKREQIIKDLEEHIKNYPNNINALKILELSYKKNHDLTKSEEIYEKIANITNKPEDYYKLGTIRFKMKKYESSIQAFNKTIQLNQKHKKAYNNKGINLIMLNKPQEAISEFNKAIKIDPNYDIAYYQKGMAFEKINDDKNAFINFKKAYNISSKPNYALKAGISANNINNFIDGEKYLNIALKSSMSYITKNDIMLYNFAKSKFKNNKLNESLEIINKALVLKPKEEKYIYLKAAIKLKNKNYEEAISLFDEVISKNPKNISAYINKANAYDNANNINEAISTLEIIANKNNPLALNNLGILYRKKKNYQKSIEIFKLASNDGNLDAKYNLATTYFENNDNKKAIKVLKEYIKLNQNNPDAFYLLGIIEYNENKNDNILKDLLKKFPNYIKNNEIRSMLKI